MAMSPYNKKTTIHSKHLAGFTVLHMQKSLCYATRIYITVTDQSHQLKVTMTTTNQYNKQISLW